MIEVGRRIKELRTRKGITVNRLANIAGISQSYLRDIEIGNKQPTVEYLSYICDALGITLAAFFTDEQSADRLTAAVNKLNSKQLSALIAMLEEFE